MTAARSFEDHFDAPELDREVWVPHYLPQWSSREASAAAYEIDGSCLRLHLPDSQPLWCPEARDDGRTAAVVLRVARAPGRCLHAVAQGREGAAA